MANAYGHGADLIGKSLQDMRIQGLCVPYGYWKYFIFTLYLQQK